MAVKDTDDYLTARAANPRTGLISPSIVTTQTPCSPMTLGEAIRVYSHSPPQRLPVNTNLGLPHQRSGQKECLFAAPRWKQHDTGWFMDTVIEVSSSSSITANSSVTRGASKDCFVIPMPSPNTSQQYSALEHTTAQLAALEHYKEKVQQGLNGRMPSRGAGPRKFAEASKRLRQVSPFEHGMAVDMHGKDLRSAAVPAVISTTTATRPSRSWSAGSADSAMAAMKDMPGGYDRRESGISIIARKLIGSPPNQACRRDSNATVITTTSTLKDEALAENGEPVATLSRESLASNTNRFLDLRQLPRVRIVHPDHDSPSCGNGIVTARLEAPEPRRVVSPPSNKHPSCSRSPHISSDLGTDLLFGPSVSRLQSQPLGAFAHTLESNPLWPWLSWPLSLMPSKDEVLAAVNTLADETADPGDRLRAGRALVVSWGKAMVLLGTVIAMFRIGVVLWQIVEIIFWPLGVIIAMVRWIVGSE